VQPGRQASGGGPDDHWVKQFVADEVRSP